MANAEEAEKKDIGDYGKIIDESDNVLNYDKIQEEEEDQQQGSQPQNQETNQQSPQRAEGQPQQNLVDKKDDNTGGKQQKFKRKGTNDEYTAYKSNKRRYGIKDPGTICEAGFQRKWIKN